MTDAEKLQLIEQIAREAFSDKWYEVPRYKVDAHRTQALANIFALFEYEGLTVDIPKREPIKYEIVEEPVEDDQITFDEILQQCYSEEGGNNDRSE